MAAQSSDMWEMRNFARPEGLWYLRHAQTLARWPIISESWAREMEQIRVLAERAEKENVAFHHR